MIDKILSTICIFAILVVGVDLSHSGSCPFLKGVPSRCSKRDKYRTIDGSCNNIKNPEWGKANLPFLRLLSPDYGNGGNPRTTPTLPGARDISSTINNDKHGDTSPVFTFMHMTFGQFLDHDVTLTKGNAGVTCGEDNCSDEGECLPISVPKNDPDFPSSTCINFVRSFGDTNCQAHREQINIISAFIDGGLIYGDDKDTNDKLRDRSDSSRGKLVITPHPVPGLKGLLPQADVPDCFNTNNSIKCFLAGDVRVNVQMGLTAIHTIYHRAHNTIEEQLHTLNPKWKGEKLYQETRRIIIAALQQITYSEYLPPIFGPKIMEDFELTLTEGDKFWNGYNSRINPGIFNNFATAAFRFGHSQIGDIIRFSNAMYTTFKDKVLSNEMLRPLSLYVESPLQGPGVDAVMRGQSFLGADIVDRHMSKQMTVHLFTPDAPFGLGSDLAARNIQRGRDHGIPGYIEWRKYCGLSKDLTDIPTKDRRTLLSVYKNMENIDLWIGGLAETHLSEAMVGPTFACLLGEQFKNLRAGDRFWFENDDRYHGFTKDQLKEIRKLTLAYLICENGDSIDLIQPKVMLQPLDLVPRKFRRKNAKLIKFLYGGDDNARVRCSEIDAPNFDEWKEKRRG